MIIVVNHLTRMQRGYICVAGIDMDTGLHVRPIPENDRPPRMQLVRHGGPFDIAAVVDHGHTSHVGHAPQVEDYRFRARNRTTFTRQAAWPRGAMV